MAYQLTDAETHEYLSLNPDAFTRFFICKELLKKSFNKKPINLLDVGGGSKYFYQSLNLDKLPYDLTVIDILPPEVKNPAYKYVQGDATKMSFKDNTFEAVVSMDVLEHISDDKKVSFIRECFRVAKDLVIIAGPFDTPETDQAEKMANDFFRSMHGRDHPWLIEHFQQNKPKQSMVETEIKRFGCPYLRFESNTLPLWLKLILLNFIPGDMVDIARVQELNRFYNENLLKLGDFDTPGYRWLYVLYKKPNLVKKFDQYFTLNPSISDKLSLQLKATGLLTETVVEVKRLQRKSDDQLIATTNYNNILTKQSQQMAIVVKETSQHSKNLEKILDDIHNSKAYKLAHGLGNFRKKVTGKS